MDKEQRIDRLTALAAALPEPDRAGPHPDDEQLAAFFDGRLNETEHRDVLRHLVNCADCYRLWLDAFAEQEAESAHVRRGIRIMDLEEARRARMAVTCMGPRPVAEVEAQEETVVYVSCPWCGAVGWMPRDADPRDGCVCGACGRGLRF